MYLTLKTYNYNQSALSQTASAELLVRALFHLVSENLNNSDVQNYLKRDDFERILAAILDKILCNSKRIRRKSITRIIHYSFMKNCFCLPDCQLYFVLEYYGTFRQSDTLHLDFFHAFNFPPPQDSFLDKYMSDEETGQIKIGLLTDLSCNCWYKDIRRQTHF